MSAYDQLKKVLQDVVAPELHAIRGDLRVVDQRIVGLDQKIDAVDARVSQKIDSLDDKIDNVDARLGEKIDGVDARVSSLRTETISMKGELIAEIRRLDARIDGVDRELRTAIENIMAYYDEQTFKDWNHAQTGAPSLKAQHPEFELWNQGIHARSGVACADCHMPYKREGAMSRRRVDATRYAD